MMIGSVIFQCAYACTSVCTDQNRQCRVRAAQWVQVISTCPVFVFFVSSGALIGYISDATSTNNFAPRGKILCASCYVCTCCHYRAATVPLPSSRKQGAAARESDRAVAGSGRQRQAAGASSRQRQAAAGSGRQRQAAAGSRKLVILNDGLLA